MAQPQSDFNNFEWLADLQKTQCYTTCDWSNPAKTSDFGCDGFTASITDWHELLQLTAPDEECGIVFVRGNFPNTPEAILARAQYRDDSGSKGTFDIHFLREPSDARTTERQNSNSRLEYTLGERRAQGLANFRWPYTQYELKRDGWISKGSYEGISFVKDGSMFQIIRLAPGRLPKVRHDQPQPPVQETQPIMFRIGGKIQFGCPCSNGIEQTSTKDFRFRSIDRGFRLVYESIDYKHHLEIQAFVNGVETFISADEAKSSGMVKVTISDMEPTIIVTAYTLRNVRDLPADLEHYPMIPNVSSKKIEKYLGISNESLDLTDKLWLASLTTQFDAVETLEICAVARYTEQILGVCSVPVLESNLSSASSDSFEITGIDFKQVPGISLVRNIVTTQYVDLGSTFWQLRFLVKAYNFLDSRGFEKSLLEDDEVKYLKKIRKKYLLRIQKHILLTLTWMTKAEVKVGKILLPTHPGFASTGPKMNAHSGRERVVTIDSSFNQACFKRMAVWYVWKYCRVLFTDEFRAYILANGLGAIPNEEELSEAKVDKESTPKNDVLLWLDMSCLLLLWQKFHSEDDTPETLKVQQRIIANSQEYHEKIVKRLRKSQSELYSTEDEELDRLFLLAHELGLPGGTSANLAKARAEQTRTRISKRGRTDMFNCVPRSAEVRKSSRITPNAPWELAFLNHCSLLRTSLDPTKELDTAHSRDACFEFFLSDYTFMTSWDRADKSMIGKWWDIEPGAVVGATFLDMIIGEEPLEGGLSRHATEDLSRSQPNISQELPTGSQFPRGLEEALRDLTQQLQAKQGFADDSRRSPRGCDWLRYKPGRYYHLKSWIQSLDDTPEIYISKSEVYSPERIEKYMTKGNNPAAKWPKYEKETSYQIFTPEDLEFLSVFDFKLKEDVTFDPHVIVYESPGEDRSWEHLLTHQDDMLKSLNDSLVDQDAKYRILFAEKCCPTIVGAFVKVWHPDALDTFENYFGSTPHFADTRESFWTTSITISHWKLISSDRLLNPCTRFYEGKVNAGRNTDIFPPPDVGNTGKALEERSSSLVITGDANGYNWICSVWTSLADSQTIKDSMKSLLRVLHLFIHKPTTGRCLVFLLILGHICEKLAVEYRSILEYLDSVVQLGEEVLFKGLEWDVKYSVENLKRIIWAGLALRILDDRLSASLSQINNARVALDNNITQDEGQMHAELLQEYINIMESFDKRFSNLSNAQARIELRIKHITGLRDGISTVTNVQDSRTTIRQGKNIGALTLLTIAYLPLTFITGLFSENHEILPTSAGKDLYACLVVLSSGLTYGLAGLLLSDELLRFFGVHWKKNGDGTGKGSNMDARSLDFNDFGDLIEGGQKIDREIPNGVGDIRRRFPIQRQNDRSSRGGGRYHNADLERQ